MLLPLSLEKFVFQETPIVTLNGYVSMCSYKSVLFLISAMCISVITIPKGQK